MEPGGEAGPDEAARSLRRIAQGDAQALERLVLRHGPALRAFAGRYLGSPAEAEEVVQDVFLTVWRSAGSYDPGRGAALAWIWRIARNRCIDRQRRRRLRWLVGLDGLEDSLPDPAPGPERQQAGRAALAAVRAGIAALPDAQRMALLLVAVGGLDTAEVAGIMGRSRGSVEQLLVRARRRLRAAVPEGAEGTDDA